MMELHMDLHREDQIESFTLWSIAGLTNEILAYLIKPVFQDSDSLLRAHVTDAVKLEATQIFVLPLERALKLSDLCVYDN